MLQKGRNILRITLIVLFMCYYGGTTLFYHTHHFEWGTVTHSHPYLPGAGSEPAHWHTAGQCQALAQLSLLQWILGCVLVVCRSGEIKCLFRLATCCKQTDFRRSYLPLRGPPTRSFL